MNELDIKNSVDKLVLNAENELETIFSRMLQEILRELDDLYRKHKRLGVEPSYTSLNRYNRVHAMMKRISDTMTSEYQEIVRVINEMEQNVYLETYLKTTYLFQVFQGEPMGFTIPTNEMLLAAIVNPIEALTLTKTLEVHRNAIVRQLQLIIQQGLVRGQGYSDIAYEIERNLGFSKNKARTVARTEAARVQSVASELTYEENSKTARIEKVWLSSLDLRVRIAHRDLDGEVADEDGYFHYKGMKSKAPLLWNVPSMDINCRCVMIAKVNGMLPAVRRGRDYTNKRYQERLNKRIAELLLVKDVEGNKEYTLAQAYNKAFKEIQPPSVKVDYITFDDWYKTYGKTA